MPHRGMVQSRRIACSLEGSAEIAGHARQLVREHDAQLGRASVDAQLVITELVTNAWRHGHGRDGRTIRVAISIQPARIGIEVHDQGVGFDRPAEHHLRGRDDGGGWGLLVVDQVAEDWGVRRNGDTCVWALITNPQT